MSRQYYKLAAALAFLLLAVCLLVVTSYAWMSLSSAPVVEGLQIAVGGGNTILIAPDETVEVDGVTYHYPGTFDSSLNLTRDDAYGYLAELGGMTPVSTADGVTWYLPVYDAYTGALDGYQGESDLSHANLSADSTEEISQGHYIYLDFWVVTPSSSYTLRVSSGSNADGSFVLALPSAVTQEDGSYALVTGEDWVSSAVRVGFLVNEDTVTDSEALYAYTQSVGYDEKYKSLNGLYDGIADLESKFTIYEPNADLHPESALNDAENGSYTVTSPIGTDGAETDVSGILTVQLTSNWVDNLNEFFHTALLHSSYTSPDLAAAYFYSGYLQNQLSAYVTRGSFLTYTTNLYAAAAQSGDGTVSAEALAELKTGGATGDVSIVTLEHNVPQRIRMFVWLEGQDVDCVGGSSSAQVAVNLQLAGGNS